jgi:hypothetical protein
VIRASDRVEAQHARARIVGFFRFSERDFRNINGLQALYQEQEPDEGDSHHYA